VNLSDAELQEVGLAGARRDAAKVALALWSDHAPALAPRPYRRCDRDAERPLLRGYRRGLRLTRAEVGAIVGVSAVQIGRYELPFGDSRRQIPREEVIRRIWDWSGGELRPADFYPQELTREPGSSDMAEARS